MSDEPPLAPPRTSGIAALRARPVLSWYNRAGVERVMGFCTDDEYQTFMGQAPWFEKALVDSGTHVTKLWFSVSRTEQRTRFAIRQLDPVRRWKLSPMDLASLDRWDDYTAAKEEMFRRTDKRHARWTIIRSNDKSGRGSTRCGSSSTSSTTRGRTARSSGGRTRCS